MQINNRTVHKMMDKLEYIMHLPHLDPQAKQYAEEMHEFLSTNFKSKPNYVRNKATLRLHTD